MQIHFDIVYDCCIFISYICIVLSILKPLKTIIISRRQETIDKETIFFFTLERGQKYRECNYGSFPETHLLPHETLLGKGSINILICVVHYYYFYTHQHILHKLFGGEMIYLPLCVYMLSQCYWTPLCRW